MATNTFRALLEKEESSALRPKRSLDSYKREKFRELLNLAELEASHKKVASRKKFSKLADESELKAYYGSRYPS